MTFKLETLVSLFDDEVLYEAICQNCRWGERFASEETRAFWCEIHVCGTDGPRPKTTK